MTFLKHYRWRDLPLNIAVMAIYVGIAKLGLSFFLMEGSVTLFWLAGGFALALLLLAGPKYIPGVFSGALVASLMVGGTPAFAILSAVANTLETLCAYYLLSYYRPIDISLKNHQDFLKLLFYGATISTLISAVIGALSLIVLQQVEPRLLVSIALRWWMADAIGIALMTPLILTWYLADQKDETKRPLELTALFVLTILMGQLIFSHWLLPPSFTDPSIAWLFPFIIWSGLRVDRRYTALLTLILFLQALWGTSHGLGYYANDVLAHGLINIWIFGLLVAVGGMLLAIMSFESRQAQYAKKIQAIKLQASEKRLQFALEASKQGWYELNIQTGQVLVSPEYPLLLGYDPAEFQSNLQDWQNNLHPDDHDAVMTAFQACLSSGLATAIEYRRRKKDGSWLWFYTTGEIAEWDHQHQALRMIGIHADITKRKLAEDKLKWSEERFRSLFTQAPIGMALVEHATGKFLEINEAAYRPTGYTEEELTNLDYWTLTPKEYHAQEFAQRNSLEMTGKFGPNEKEYIRKDGARYPIRISGFMTLGHDQQKLVWGIIEDLTERKQAEEKLNLAASVFTHARESILITDAAGTILDVNHTFTDITGYSREEVLGKNPRILQSGRQSSEFYAAMWQALKKEGYWYGEVWNRRKNGQVYAEMKTISAVRDAQGLTSHYVALCTDITPMKKHQQQLERIAHYDILTNLPNRVLLADRLTQAMVQSQRHQNSLAVVFLDLDGFKVINDTHGHDIGDELLIIVAQRMKEALREGDTLSRFGGDEFVAVLADLTKAEDCEPVLDRLLLAASAPVTVDNITLNVSASIGVTLYPLDNTDAEQLIRHADQAMYTAKGSGKNRYHLFDITQDNAVKIQRESLEAIRKALDEQQFVLYYQPKVNIRTGTVIGVEALIRWQHPERGLLPPSEFLSIIENHTMSIEMGEWVLDTVLTQINLWQEMGLTLPVSTSVNIGALQLQGNDFVTKLTALLAAHPDVDPHYLELEVLETSALDDVVHVSAVMDACMALGVNFALDDFGTGYSSLTYLRRLPANLIKIDQSFVRDMLIDTDDLAIVKGIIALAQSFKRDVIAEGVETIEHGTVLLQLGCELAQGYGIAKPMPAGHVPRWITNWKPKHLYFETPEQ